MPSLSLFALVNGLLTVVDMVKTIGSKVEDGIYEVFRLACEREGVTVSDRLRDLVNKFVKEEAPYLVIDSQVCVELKRIAKEKGVDWREMSCEAILKFCEKCSEAKEAKTEGEKGEEAKEASTEEKKPKERSIVSILKGEEEEKEEAHKEESSIEEKLKTHVKIIRE